MPVKTKTVFFALWVLIFSFTACQAAQTQEEGKPASVRQSSVLNKTATPPRTAVRRKEFSVIFGSVDSVDRSSSDKVVLRVTDDADGTVHTILATPRTNVTKVTDISELKPGDSIRVMTRTIDNNAYAMTVVFGNIKKMTGVAARMRKESAKNQPLKNAIDQQ